EEGDCCLASNQKRRFPLRPHCGSRLFGPSALLDMSGSRRFPPPWDIEEHDKSCFIVRDNNRQALAYVYFEDEPSRRTAAGLLTRDEVRRIAANIAKIPQYRRGGVSS